MKRIFLPFILILIVRLSFAATVDTVLTYSPSMKKIIKAVVIKPDSYSTAKKLPVVYLLHGYGGNHTDWIRKVPAITQYADLYNLIIVCPDGNVSSWYIDSPVDSAWKYETYVSGELVKWIDDHFNTIRDRKGRAIMGLSMGGHGALYISFRHQECFGAAGSMSGGVDLTPFPSNWELARRLGDYDKNPATWKAYSVINMTNLLKPGALAVTIECGADDFFYKANIDLHEKLLAAKIPHDFTIRPGGHTWDYWSNAIGYQMLFMHNYFIKAS